MNEQQDKNAPIQSFKNGAVSIKLWQNQGPEQSFVNVSVRKLYKDEQSNQWKESKNFSPNDLPKLQAILPEAVQAAHSHEYTLNSQREQQAPSQQQEQGMQHISQVQPAMQQQPPAMDMAAKRDAVMQQVNNHGVAAPSQQHAPSRTPPHDHTR